MNDHLREQTIEALKRLLHTAKTRQTQIFYWESMKRLIAGRSPEQIARMEARFHG